MFTPLSSGEFLEDIFFINNLEGINKQLKICVYMYVEFGTSTSIAKLMF